jgi:hypothetical protein
MKWDVGGGADMPLGPKLRRLLSFPTRRWPHCQKYFDIELNDGGRELEVAVGDRPPGLAVETSFAVT